MSERISQIALFGAALIIALGLFAFGLGYPLPMRVRGDAYVYLVIANGFDGFAAALGYLGERTAGMPLFEYAVRRALGLFTSTDQPQPWVDIICTALFCVHIASCWVFANWMKEAGWVLSPVARAVLFFFLATYPALVGHTTAPLTDTLAIDLILCGCALLARSMDAQTLQRALTFALSGGLLFGYSILVRSGSLPGMAAGLAAAFSVTLSMGRRRQAAIAAAVLGCVVVLAPYYANCLKAHGSLCLQYPVFDPLPGAQAGLHGMRTPWAKPISRPDEIPTLQDPYIMANYGDRCELTSMGGIRTTSLTGCLLSRPLAIPAFVFKKWVGLFDHFRFTPYVELLTPGWLLWLSRSYDGLAWIGFALAFPLGVRALRRHSGLEVKDLSGVQPAMVALGVYAACTLAIHTALHVEDRYSFPWLPLCAVVLVACAERVLAAFRLAGWRAVALPVAYGAMAAAAFFAQVLAWDAIPF